MKRLFFIWAGIFSLAALVFLLSADSASATDSARAEQTLPFEEQHKDKSYIFLLDDYSVELNEGWSYVTRTHKKARIQKEDARSMGEIPIRYNKGQEKITSFTALTTTPDGKKYPYSKAQDLKIEKGFPMYSDAMAKVLTLPEVNIGSVLEYESTVITRQGPVKDAFWEELSITNGGIPTKEMNVKFTFPKRLNIQYREFNLKNKPLITENDTTITYTWHVENLYTPPDREDLLPPPTVDSINEGVEFSSINSWSDISNWYYAAVEKNLKITPAIKETAEKATKGFLSLREKTKAILEYVQDNFRYVSMSFGANALEPYPTDEVFKNKYGDCKDLSLLCMAMLKVCGINSYIALFNNDYDISDPQHDLPIPTLFDHALLLVEDPQQGDFYIDTLLKGYDIGQYPLDYQRAYTFIITENGGRFGRFPEFDEKRIYSNKERVITINPDGSATIEVNSIWSLDSSINIRLMLQAANEEEKKRFEESLDALFSSDGKLIERHIDGVEDRYGSLKSRSKFTKNNAYPITDDMIIIDIRGFERSEYYTEKERKNPIFYPVNSLDEETTIYRVPAGFRIAHVPGNLDLHTELFSFKRQYKVRSNEITISETTRYKRCEVPQKEYQRLKDFEDKLPTKTRQRIILKRTKPWHQGLKNLWQRFSKK